MKKIIFLGLLGLSLTFTWSACNEPTTLGADFIEDNEFLNAVFTDTFTLNVQTIQLDTFLAVTKSNYLLGALNDETFGHASAGIYSDVLLGANDVTFGKNPVLDSIVLTLRYDNVLFGDTTSLNSIYVYELNEEINDTINYYTKQTFDYQPTPLGELQNIGYNYLDSVQLSYYTTTDDGRDSSYFTKTPPHLRIPLDNELGERILQKAAEDTLRIDGFNDLFKGFYVQPDPENKTMVSFNMRSSFSQITLYYANDSTKGNIYNFRIDATTPVVSNYQIDYGTSIVGNQLNAAYPNSQEYIYMQSLDGLGFQVDAPFFKTHNSEKYLLNKVELEMTLLPQEGVMYSDDTQPDGLVMSSYLTDSLVYDIERFNSNTTLDTLSATVGDLLQIKFNTATAYRTSINGYYQGLIDGTFVDGENSTNRNTLFFMNLQDFTGYRAVFGGPKHPDYPMRLKAIYTPIND